MLLTDHDLVSVLRRTPKLVFEALKAHEGKLFMAGGFIRACVANEDPSDIDLFAPSKDYGQAVATQLAKDTGKDLCETDNAFTIYCRPAPIQIIHRWTFATPAECIESFDFTIAQAAAWWNGHGWTSICSDRFYADLASKRLVYLSPKRNEDAGGSLIRVLKFYQRGYRIPLESLAAVVARILQGVKPTQERGWDLFMQDEAYRTKILTGLLYEVDPNADPSRYIAPSPEQIHEHE